MSRVGGYFFAIDFFILYFFMQFEEEELEEGDEEVSNTNFIQTVNLIRYSSRAGQYINILSCFKSDVIF